MVDQLRESASKLRERDRKMDDVKLLEMGRAAKYMCLPQANHGRPPRDCFVQHLPVVTEV